MRLIMLELTARVKNNIQDIFQTLGISKSYLSLVYGTYFIFILHT